LVSSNIIDLKEMTEHRQLAAIMFTDIVGYSALMSKDEKLAMEVLEKNREIHKDAISKHHGQYIKEIGDGTLSIFQSSVDAVNCAMEIQQACCTEKEFQVRIGIHIGDVIFRDNDVFGDGVNIASRIESSGEPGGIYFSERVYEDIKNKADIRVKYEGEKKLKNIEDPVKIYSLLFNERERADRKMISQKRKKILWITMMFLIGAALTFAVILLLDLRENRQEEHQVEVEKSIAVLPLSNWSQDKEYDYLGDAMADEIILQLSKIHELRVLSLTSTSRYKDDPKPMSQIGDELGVNYIIEGGIQRHDNNLSIRIQLLRAKNEGHLWGEEYNGKWEDIFSFQDEIARNIASELQAVLSPEEINQINEEPTRNIEAYRLYLKGQSADILDAIEYFKQAIEIDSRFALAWAGLAYHYGLQMWYLPPSMDVLPVAEMAASRALELDKNLSEVYHALGMLSLTKWNWAESEKYYERAIELNPNIAVNLVNYGCILTYTGRLEEARTMMEKALLLDPLSTGAVNNLGMVNITARKYDEVIRITEEALKFFPLTTLHTYLGQAYLYKGMFEKALLTFQEQENEIWVGVTYAMMGKKEKALDILNRIEKRADSSYVSPFLKSLLLFSLDYTDEGFKSLETAFEIHDLELTEITTYPLLDQVSSDPRYKQLLKKMGLR
jgi:TolB-like protein/class 3 adenylate cyclase/Tfp pilus assembly protein PilF